MSLSLSNVTIQGTLSGGRFSTSEQGGEAGTLIARADFTQHGLVPTTITGYESTTSWWQFNDGLSSIGVASNYMELDYPETVSPDYATGGLGLTIEDLQAPEIYVDFYARMPSVSKGGFKFCKFFGGVIPTNQTSNCTWGFIYGSAVMEVLAFGDGSTTSNDSNNVIFYDGSNPSLVGRSFGTAVVDTPVGFFSFDDNWHRFQMRMKYNTGTTAGNEVADGEFELLIDGTRRLLATNVFNRHYSNLRYFEKITFGDWAQASDAFVINYRDIKVSVGGWV